MFLQTEGYNKKSTDESTSTSVLSIIYFCNVYKFYNSVYNALAIIIIYTYISLSDYRVHVHFPRPIFTGIHKAN